MPYTIYDAIKDEIDFLKTLEKVEENAKHTITAAIVNQQRVSLNRILRRVDSGYDYSMGVDKDTGKPVITWEKTNRKTLEQEYPALQKAAEQYDIVKNFVDSTPDD
jgi:hypothetical protein